MSQTTADWIANVHGEMIAKIAKREHRGLRTLDVDDITQSIHAEFAQLSHKNDFTLWETNGIAALAGKMARKYVNRERTDYMYFSANFIYTPSMVETYLAECVWTELDEVPDVDGRVDVRREFDKLPLNHRQVLFIKYGLGETFEHTDPRRKMAERALDRLTARLNTGAQREWVELSDVA